MGSRSVEFDLARFQQDFLESHNNLRSHHGCQGLQSSRDLNRSAQKWADKLAEKGFLQYTENGALGESISFITVNGLEPSAEEITKQWYNENAKYNYESPGWRKGIRHFSQVVWRATQEMGVGISKFRDKDTYVVVAHYKPPGNTNMPGDFKKNVPSVLKHTTP